MFLKQSTAVDVLIGPFVDSTDGYTAETGLSPAVKLSKNGQTLGAKNDATTPVHDADGFYNCELDATDTNTVGELDLSVVGSATSLPFFKRFYVVEERVYDALFGASAAGWDTGPQKNVALNNVTFYMVDANDHITPETGLSGITEEISQDGGAFAACTNAAVEISDGYYKINLTAAEMNADLITVRFNHANADEVGYTFTTQEV